jgi:hypothetical protein
MELNSLGVALAAERIAQSHQQARPPRPQARRTGRCRHHAVPTLKETAMAVESTSPWQAAARAAARSGRGGFGAGQDLRHDPGRRRHRPGRACTCTATRANSSPIQRSMPMTSEATGYLDLTVMVAFHDAFRRDLGHLARAASRRPAELDQPARHTAVQAGWELLTTQPHLHTPPRTPTCGRACAATWPTVPTSWPCCRPCRTSTPASTPAGRRRRRACRPRRRPPASG